MGGFFAAALREDCVFDLFFGTDYHSHLGTRRAGLAVYGKKGFDRAIHNIENSPFRTKFEKEANAMQGTMGIGCISDYDPQPLVVRSHHGTYAITTVGRVNNKDRLLDVIMKNTGIHFFEMTSGDINSTELVAALINQKDSLVEGIRSAQEMIDGSMTLLVLTTDGVYCARDRFGRTPLTIGLKDEGFCASFEPFAYLNLGYRDYKELGPGEIDLMTPEGVTTLVPPEEKMRICTFLWVYYGYPSSHYEGVSVEQMRYNCGRMLARRDGMSRERIDTVAGVPDSGIAHAIGYANESGVPFSRPLIKYTPTWPRSFMPTIQSKRDMIAKMKLIPVHELIEKQRMLLIDDSIVRGTQLRKTTEFLFRTGAREVHARPACPPIMFGCKYINFSRSNSDMELIARRIVSKLEGHEPERAVLDEYCDPESERYAAMLEGIRRQMGFSSLKFNRLDDMLAAVGVEPCKLCTYCWNGRE
ncbi:MULTISPECIES: amidophosphoribosyltransferase [unclassified Pyramidobacter]|uniref:amidophosphoribosyltransferase n=1 Tax=unclassified Pyramidobacter TaxID=2632171 RepID=UPI0025CE24BD|nr:MULTISPECIES: amidophosphoribosyltransferase [unclassified Pyramidobacter]MCI7403713.1 amidophosphoribosyltransferase [Pyramidobacter sp.]MDY3212767.1 amidophosphoribosyltransferase [Pyramidobacter sp.]WOL40245.1 amidophosphoribosyltransferase [Pyramidobacter sp. YE332]